MSVRHRRHSRGGTPPIVTMRRAQRAERREERIIASWPLVTIEEMRAAIADRSIFANPQRVHLVVL